MMNLQDRQIRYWAHMLDESRLDESNQAVIADLESSFGDWIWQEGNTFFPNNIHLKQMFRLINKHVFNNELDEGVQKFVKDERELKPKERGAMAAFEFGMVKGVGEEHLLVVRHQRADNFFVVFNSMIHEMIHMYDFHFGPMGRMLDKWRAVCGLDWNYPHPKYPYTIDGIVAARREHLRDLGLDPEQLPPEMKAELDKRPRAEWQAHPRQYQMPGMPVRKIQPDGSVALGTKPLPMKYRLDQLNGFYDVHGSYFQQLANHANRLGFAVDDVFYPNRKYAMRRVDEDPDETPEDLRYMPEEALETILDRIDDPGKGLEFEDEDNWTIRIV